MRGVGGLDTLRAFHVFLGEFDFYLGVGFGRCCFYAVGAADADVGCYAGFMKYLAAVQADDYFIVLKAILEIDVE